MALVGLLLAEADYAAIAIMANRAYCVTQVLSVRCARPASKGAGVRVRPILPSLPCS